MHSLINSLVSNFERGTMTRRQLISALTGLTAAAGLAPRVTAGATREDEPMFQATSLNHIALSVTDVGRPLLSVAQIVQNGSRVVFSAQGSYHDNSKTK